MTRRCAPPGRRRGLIAFSVAAALLSLPALAPGRSIRTGAGPQAGGALPDLVPRPPYDIQVEEADPYDTEGLALRFSIATANLSNTPLDVMGVPQDSETTTAMQCTAWEARACTQRADVGDFVWHPAHRHWHFTNFAVYELRRLSRNRTPDMSRRGLVGSSRKISFCLVDSQPSFTNVTAEEFAGMLPLYQVCSPVLQGISPGWMDIYDWTLEGQELPVLGVPNGDYAVVVTINRDHRILESYYTNNVAFTRITISRDDEGIHVAAKSR